MTVTTTSGGTPARRKMIETMDMKGLSANTQDIYLHSVSMLARFYDRPPQSLSAEEVDAWVLGRIDAGLSPCSTNVDVTALRLFYVDTVDQPEKVRGLHGRRVPDRLPRSIPEADVRLLIEGINDLRYRTATLVAYGCALRISEVVALQVDDVRSEDRLLHVACGKG
ncbi:MAG: phage integrase N-terminal SAM-like domain-containing protein, partial [bacterium]|nr:phage integrase N-terminal SAM-like domain-containing protein [bacterium]